MQVVSSSGDEVFFKIKRSTKLSKLQGAYANKVGKDVSSIRYVSVLTLCDQRCANMACGGHPDTDFDGYIELLIHSFLYDGQRINEDDTPATLDMEDNGRWHQCSILLRADRRIFARFKILSTSWLNVRLTVATSQMKGSRMLFFLPEVGGYRS